MHTQYAYFFMLASFLSLSICASLSIWSAFTYTYMKGLFELSCVLLQLRYVKSKNHYSCISLFLDAIHVYVIVYIVPSFTLSVLSTTIGRFDLLSIMLIYSIYHFIQFKHRKILH